MSYVFTTLSSFFSIDPNYFRPLARLILFAWCIHALNWGIGRGALNYVFGIHPRQAFGLIPGIITSHFLHAGYLNLPGINPSAHIVANTVKFFSFGYPVALNGNEIFRTVTISTALFSGAGAWVFGQDRYPYIGPEGVIYGYVGFLLVYGLDTGIDISTPWTGPGRIAFFMLAVVGFFVIFINAIVNFVKTILGWFGVTEELLERVVEADVIEDLDEVGDVTSPTKSQLAKEQDLVDAVFQILLFRRPEGVVCGFIGGMLTAYALMLHRAL